MSDSRNTSPTTGTVLRTDHVSRVYEEGRVKALDDVSLEIRRGEYVAIMGPSGSGKSTLLNLLGALDRPTSGEVYFEDQPLSQYHDLDRFRSQKLGFIFQSFYLLPTLSALENVQIPMFETSLTVTQRVERARELLGKVGMGDRADHLPSKLSVGQRQRVAIARALANNPIMLLADEPTGNLDTKSGDDVLDLFEQLHREHGVTLVVITHSHEVAERAQRVIWIRDGRVSELPDPKYSKKKSVDRASRTHFGELTGDEAGPTHDAQAAAAGGAV